MSRHYGTFRWSRELGEALRGLRRRAGLTQAQVAEAMGGLGKTGRIAVGRLESGRAAQPGFGLVADYLRACRASFADLAPVLDAYTSRPTIATVQVAAFAQSLARALPPEPAAQLERYTIKTRAAGDSTVSTDKRFERLRKTARSLVLRKRLETCLHGAVSRLGVTLPEFGKLCAYGRAVWGALGRARRKHRGDYANEVAAVEPKYASAGTAEQRAAVRNAVIELFGSLEQSGELDRLPGAAEAAALAGRKRVERADRQHLREVQAVARVAEMARWSAIQELVAQARKLLEEAGVASGVVTRCGGAAATWWHIYSRTADGTPERDKLVREQRNSFGARGLDAALFDRIGELVLARFSAGDSTPVS
jgi:transcriptional regulator with XRE-family HTH domain